MTNRYVAATFIVGVMLIAGPFMGFAAGRTTASSPALPDQTGIRSATTTMGALILASVPTYVADTDGFPKYLSAKQLPNGKWVVVETVVVAEPAGDTYVYNKFWIKGVFTADGEPLDQGKVIKKRPYIPPKKSAA